MAKNFFITTAIDYPSAPPHLGHMYEKVCADVFARWHRLRGENVHFSTGIDCHGSKIARYASQAGMPPEKFVAKMEKHFLDLCSIYNVSYDDFIRTIEPRHQKIVAEIILDLEKKGAIYHGNYSGYYCSDCETYYNKEELVNGSDCPTHNKKTEYLDEDSYFFKMSAYKDALLKQINDNPDLILPEKRRNEMLSRLKEPLQDLSLTREKISWGIPFPLDKDLKVTSIWIDALINYLTTVDYSKKKFKDFWPPLHFIGVDINWHHSVIWGTLLTALNIKLPKVYVHGFIRSASGEKMSKSLGNVIDPIELVQTFPVDSIRYYVMKDIPLGNDGNFSEDLVKERLNNELANDLGNLLSRTLAMIEKYNAGVVPSGVFDKKLSLDFEKIDLEMESLHSHAALELIWDYIRNVNKYVNDMAPWELAKNDTKKLNDVLYTLAESLKFISILVDSFLPDTAEKMRSQLNLKKCTFKDLKPGEMKNKKVKKGENLFTKLE